jgi:hypothetical protein
MGSDPFDRFGLFGGRAGGFQVIAGSMPNPTLVPTPATELLLALAALCYWFSRGHNPARQPASPPARCRATRRNRNRLSASAQPGQARSSVLACTEVAKNPRKDIEYYLIKAAPCGGTCRCQSVMF